MHMRVFSKQSRKVHHRPYGLPDIFCRLIAFLSLGRAQTESSTLRPIWMCSHLCFFCLKANQN